MFLRGHSRNYAHQFVRHLEPADERGRVLFPLDLAPGHVRDVSASEADFPLTTSDLRF